MLADFVVENKIEQIFVISPHLDDAILSCYGMIEACRNKAPLQVITVHAGDAPTHSASASHLETSLSQSDSNFLAQNRRKEDAQIFCEWQIPFLHLNFVDALFRKNEFGQNIYSWETLWQMPLEEDVPHLKNLSFVFDKIFMAGQKTLILSPMGFGGHVDHISCAIALLNIQNKKTNQLEILFYEDFPYVWNQGLDYGRKDSLNECMFRLGIKPEKPFLSQFVLEDKINFINKYENQARLLFGSAAKLRTATEYYNDKSIFAERVWSAARLSTHE